jgi:peptidoglycan/xylan/chitin deacetylase (PgdA/CDA1 family)
MSTDQRSLRTESEGLGNVSDPLSVNVSWRDRFALAAGRLVGTKGAVLCLHGLDLQEDPARASLHISLEQFQAIVAAIRDVGQLVPLEDIVTRQLNGRSTRGLVALTADDAYASWLAAESVLISQAIPLTVFAVADALTTGSRFWWDRVTDSAFLASLERWRRFEHDCGLPDAYRQGQPAAEGVTRPLRQWVLAEHAGRWPAALEETLARLEGELGHRTNQRSMSEVELSGFLTRTGAQLAVHTISHAALPFVSDHELITEVRQGHEQLRTRFPDTLPYLAIPYGLFDARTLRLAADAGVKVSMTLQGHALDRTFSAGSGMSRLCVVRENTPGMLMLSTSRIARPLKRLRDRTHDNPFPVLPSATT